MSILVADGLTHWFGRDVALESIDLALDAGEHMAVLGENGAGKTTLLRILATAARPTSGRLEIMGLDALRERRRLRRKIGFVAHAPGLYPALTAKENLEFFCTLQDVSRARVAETLSLVGLTEVAGRPAGQLSRGMQQRLAIGRAILHDPKLLVLDEPDSSLGTDGPELLAAVMRDRTVVLATHDHALANKLCRRTLVLRHGRSLGTATRLHVVK
ncbi:MAG TPA: heme ABC exporter ATP-binding protein CcmA [Candidatus Dormibacteraeota bacterium]|jgi:heme ABC exporter ATP-binding subunit CcmA|nr:heme ABC exporter ATP-binding protein CcmA [Candidatus Dormibacteraeota bacterium]